MVQDLITDDTPGSKDSKTWRSRLLEFCQFGKRGIRLQDALVGDYGTLQDHQELAFPHSERFLFIKQGIVIDVSPNLFAWGYSIGEIHTTFCHQIHGMACAEYDVLSLFSHGPPTRGSLATYIAKLVKEAVVSDLVHEWLYRRKQCKADTKTSRGTVYACGLGCREVHFDTMKTT